MWPFTRKDDEWVLLDIVFGPTYQLDAFSSVQAMMYYWFNPKTREFKVNCSGGAKMSIIGKVPTDITDELEYIYDQMYENIWWPMLGERLE